jgi:hypothetical protein
MRIPDIMLRAPVFLCVDIGGQFRMGGTAFFVTLGRDPAHLYLVTARHCVEHAKAYGDLYVRLNKEDGGSEVLPLDPGWYYSESEADDVVVMPIPMEWISPYDIWPFELATWLATEEVIKQEGIGIGDEVIIVGLFTRRDGKHQNRPIVRSGIIAAMPDEPLEDEYTGLEYDAYLMEIRSIGGLSGSPVLVEIAPGRVHEHKFEMERRVFYLIGLVRGHWRKEALEEFADYGEQETEQLNTGIAIVTPIQKAVDVIMNTKELVEERKRYENWWANRRAPKED